MSGYWTAEEDAAFRAAADGVGAAIPAEDGDDPRTSLSPTPAVLAADGAPSANGKRAISFISAASVKPERVRWVWEKRIPLGSLTILAGQQGLGKSTLTLELAARASRGELEGDLYGERCSSLVVTLEDHVASVVIPRLRAAGADLERIRIVGVKAADGLDALVSLPEDIPGLEAGALEHQARLVIVDPIVATLAGSIDAHKDHSVRRALAPLAKAAERCGFAALAIMHLSKANADDLLTRVSGSVAFTAAARSVLVFARHPDDPDNDEGNERVIVHAKSNVSPKQAALACLIEPRMLGAADGKPISTSQLVITGECAVTADDLARRGNDERAALDEAVESLADQLADGEWQEYQALRTALVKGAGISVRTLQRAADRLGVERERRGFPSRSCWRLVAVVPTQSCQAVAPLDGTTVDVNNGGGFLASTAAVMPDAELGTTAGWRDHLEMTP
jgi:hypothetical protein